MTDSYFGKIVASVEGLERHSDDVTIRFTDGSSFWMHHYQDCCENVWLADIDGEVNVGDVWHGFDERSEDKSGTMGENGYECESATWTFYTLHTSKGYVWLRFIGESNGYYSEGVSHGYTEAGKERSRW